MALWSGSIASPRRSQTRRYKCPKTEQPFCPRAFVLLSNHLLAVALPTAEAGPVLFPDEAVPLDAAAFRDELAPDEPHSSDWAQFLDEVSPPGVERFPDEACSPGGVGSRGEACFARRVWSPSEVHSPVEMQLADVVPQDGLLELRLVAFLGEERWSQVPVGQLGCWPVVEKPRVRQEDCMAHLRG